MCILPNDGVLDAQLDEVLHEMAELLVLYPDLGTSSTDMILQEATKKKLGELEKLISGQAFYTPGEIRSRLDDHVKEIAVSVKEAGPNI